MVPLAIGAVWYFVLLIVFAPIADASRPPLDTTFNSMLDHLLHGRFDVDPAVVGDEGFTRGGRVYAYWGIAPALLRLPLVWLPGWQGINVTLLSCWLAATTALAAKLWTLRRIADRVAGVPAWLVRLVGLALVLSGAQICFLRPSIFQEVCLWGGAIGAVFVAGAIASILDGVTRARLLAMAAAAAIALSTRVSVGIGLLAAFALVVMVFAIRERHRPRRLVGRLAAPLAVVALGLAAVALVNWARWGNPLTFADYSAYNMNALYPDRLPRTERYGLFNPARIPFGLLYYFAPLWAVSGEGGTLLFATTRDRLIDAVELPPASFLWTDPLLLALGAIGVLRTRAALPRVLLLGLAIPAALMLCAISMCFRYRLDFYPLIEAAAFLGLIALAGRHLGRTARRTLTAAAAVGIVGSHLTLLLYQLSQTGPVQDSVRHGIVDFYYRQAVR